MNHHEIIIFINQFMVSWPSWKVPPMGLKCLNCSNTAAASCLPIQLDEDQIYGVWSPKKKVTSENGHPPPQKKKNLETSSFQQTSPEWWFTCPPMLIRVRFNGADLFSPTQISRKVYWINPSQARSIKLTKYTSSRCPFSSNFGEN